MKSIYHTVAVALSLAAFGLGTAYASTAAPGANPAQRGERDSFFYGPLNKGNLTNPLDANQISRPKDGPRAVTPVPEPSQWAMMLAGLALVGFIVKRRNGAR